jgi:hypothetical protein
MLGLRVCRSGDVERPGLLRILIRFAVFFALTTQLPRFVALFADSSDFNSPERLGITLLVGLLAYPLELLGIGLLVSTMRQRNGWRGLHEFASGTRVIQLPDVSRHRVRSSVSRRAGLSRPDGLPAKVGPFRVVEALRWDEASRLLIAEDGSLGRLVLLWLRHADAPTLGINRRECARPTRLRWLAGGEMDGWQWDAFPAPTSQPLNICVAEEGFLTWTEFRPVLEQLSEELVAAKTDGTLPEALTVDQVWLDSDGGVLLLDAPLRAEAISEHAVDSDPAVVLLAESAVLALEGSMRSPARRVHALLPRHAAVLLGRLLGGERALRSVDDFRSELALTQDRPTEVTRARRATHVAVLAALVTVGSCCCLSNVWLLGNPTGWINLTGRLQQQLRQDRVVRRLEAAAAGEFIADTFNPQPLARPVAVYRLTADLELRDRLNQRVDVDKRELQEHVDAAVWVDRKFYLRMEPLVRQIDEQAQVTERAEVRSDVRAEAQQAIRQGNAMEMGLSLLEGWSLVSAAVPLFILLLLAVLFRGGLTFSLMGFCLIRRDGRPAGHLRCAWRALVAWGPPTLLLMAAVALDIWFWTLAQVETRQPWMPLVSGVLRWTVPLIVVLYPVLAIRFPQRTLHDWLAGTYIVPR